MCRQIPGLKLLHFPANYSLTPDGACCGKCDQKWPCEFAQLQAEREAAQRNADEWKSAWYEVGQIIREAGGPFPDIAASLVWLRKALAALPATEAARE